jgi:hypothetical protein
MTDESWEMVEARRLDDLHQSENGEREGLGHLITLEGYFSSNLYKDQVGDSKL